jgi:hypothetical protein
MLYLNGIFFLVSINLYYISQIDNLEIHIEHINYTEISICILHQFFTS